MVVMKIEIIAIYASHWALCLVLNGFSISVPFFFQQPENMDIICIGLERAFSHQKQKQNKTETKK